MHAAELSMPDPSRPVLSAALCFFPPFFGHHNHMPAALAFQAKVHSDPQNLPFITAAGMWFFQTDHITHFILKAFHFPFLTYFKICMQKPPVCRRLWQTWKDNVSIPPFFLLLQEDLHDLSDRLIDYQICLLVHQCGRFID